MIEDGSESCLRLRCSSPRSLFRIRRFVGTPIAFLPLRYGPVTLPRVFETFSGVPEADDLAAEAAGAGAEVEQAVGSWR